MNQLKDAEKKATQLVENARKGNRLFQSNYLVCNIAGDRSALQSCYCESSRFSDRRTLTSGCATSGEHVVVLERF